MIVYALTGGVFTVGWIADGCLLGRRVDSFNNGLKPETNYIFRILEIIFIVLFLLLVVLAHPRIFLLKAARFDVP